MMTDWFEFRPGRRGWAGFRKLPGPAESHGILGLGRVGWVGRVFSHKSPGEFSETVMT
jgi:hypothetical protein